MLCYNSDARCVGGRRSGSIGRHAAQGGTSSCSYRSSSGSVWAAEVVVSDISSLFTCLHIFALGIRDDACLHLLVVSSVMFACICPLRNGRCWWKVAPSRGLSLFWVCVHVMVFESDQTQVFPLPAHFYCLILR